MKSRWYRWIFIVAAAVVLVLGLRSCFAANNLADRAPGEKIDAELTLKTVTLEQPDEDGTLLWRLKAKSVTYIPDTQRAELLALKGEFFQDGETVYTIEADEGEVLQNGNTLFLRGNLVATGSENDLVLEGETLKWQPKQDLLVMGEFDDAALFGATVEASVDDAESNDAESNDAEEEESDDPEDVTGDSSKNASDREGLESSGGAENSVQNDWRQESSESAALAPSVSAEAAPVTIDDAPVTGFTPQLKTAARLVTVNNRENRVQLLGGVLAESKEEPWLTFESEALTWFTARELIEAKQPLTVEQYENDNYQTVTDRLVGGAGQIELAENRVTLEEDVQLDVLTQPLMVRSEQAVWNIDAETVEMNRLVDIEQPEQQVTAVANQARLDLASQVIYLEGDVQAVGKKNDAHLNADRVVWETSTQQVEADGNVRYRQAADPEISIAGPRAVGDIEAGTLVIEGGDAGEVVTEIVPDGF